MSIKRSMDKQIVVHPYVLSRSVVSDSLQLQGLQPSRLFCPPGFSRQEQWSALPCPPPGDNKILLSHAPLVAQMIKCLPAMQETWVRSLGQEDPLEKEMATHSSTLDWKIPWMKEPSRLQSMGSQSQTLLSNFTGSQKNNVPLL